MKDEQETEEGDEGDRKERLIESRFDRPPSLVVAGVVDGDGDGNGDDSAILLSNVHDSRCVTTSSKCCCLLLP